ncbi:hypothetical protein QAD02_009510 [Eretmocerus hayati]|uniref:Uncharacterized protein n=1 Tax=Eretmocerus hayati TaxID=131215 RepID=A0ACC2N9L8_9HYME|nr:hypothetical protein QAD02_009510 [Eretmocerus hayati]
MKRSPYRARFGQDPKVGLASSSLPREVIAKLESEEQLVVLLNNRSTSSESATSDLQVDLTQEDVGVTNQLASDAHLDRLHEYMEKAESEQIDSHKCSACQSPLHIDCGASSGEINEIDEIRYERIICYYCQSEKDITDEQRGAHEGVKRAAEKMLEFRRDKFPALDEGCSVLVSVPKFDRGPLDAKIILGTIVEIKNGMYKVGTSVRTLKNWYSQGDIQPSSVDFSGTICSDEISLREALSKSSIFGGQGFQRCNCQPSKTQCQILRCSCFKKQLKCNSRCHASSSCANKN